jgi:hypothetical protein
MPVASTHFRALIRECATPREYCASESPDRHAAKHGYLGICTRRLIPVEVAEFVPQCGKRSSQEARHVHLRYPEPFGDLGLVMFLKNRSRSTVH